MSVLTSIKHCFFAKLLSMFPFLSHYILEFLSPIASFHLLKTAIYAVETLRILKLLARGRFKFYEIGWKR